MACGWNLKNRGERKSEGGWWVVGGCWSRIWSEFVFHKDPNAALKVVV
jgi:hypothetical protein